MPSIDAPHQAGDTPLTTETEEPGEGDEDAEDPAEDPGYRGELAIPDCPAMNPAAEALADKFYALATAGVTAPRGSTDLQGFNDAVGPSARAAMAKATRVEGCTWPVSYHDVITQYIAQLGDADRAALIASLRASDYIESSLNGHPRFDYRVEFSGGYSMTITYVFVADAWLVLFGGYDGSVVEAAFASLVGSNPGIELVPAE